LGIELEKISSQHREGNGRITSRWTLSDGTDLVSHPLAAIRIRGIGTSGSAITESVLKYQQLVGFLMTDEQWTVEINESNIFNVDNPCVS
jgi:hypothetical protein